MSRIASGTLTAALALVLCGAGPWMPDDAGDFHDFTLSGLDGRPVSTADLRQGRALVVSVAGTWCGYCRQQSRELVKLRGDFDSHDLAIVEVYVGEDPATVAAHVGKTPLTVLIDPGSSLAEREGIDAVPVVWVVAPDGRIVWEKNYTPRAWLRDRVKVALATLDRTPAAATEAGKAQSRCPVCEGPLDAAIFADRVVDGDSGVVDGGRVLTLERTYFCSQACKHAFDKDPDRYLEAMSASGVTPEKVWLAVGADGGRQGELCRPCGHIKGSPEFLRYWSKPKASSLTEGHSSPEVADLDPETGLPKDAIGNGAIR